MTPSATPPALPRRLVALGLAAAGIVALGGPAAAQELDPFERAELGAFAAGFVGGGDRGGLALAAEGLRLAYGAPKLDGGAGAVHLTMADARLELPGGGLILGAPGSELGSALDLDGDRLAVGAPGGLHPTSGLATGLVAVYELEPGGVAVQDTALVAPTGGAAGEEFGTSVLLDGDRLFVGAPYARLSASIVPGVVYVFERDAATGAWVQTAKLLSSTADDEGELGAALALQGGELFVGAPGEGFQSGFLEIARVGAVYRFEDAGGFVERERIESPFKVNQTAFGSRLAVSGDTLAVGAPTAQSGQLSIPGRVFVLERDAQGTPGDVSDDAFSITQTLDPGSPATGQRFGASLALDGELLVVGAPWFEAVGSPSTPPGRVHLFERVGAGFAPRKVIVSPDPAPCCSVSPLGGPIGPVGDLFGIAVALTRGPNRADHGLFVGAPRADYVGLPPVCLDTTVFPFAVVPCTSPLPAGVIETVATPGGVYRYRLALQREPREVSLASGGVHELRVDGGASRAGRVYAVLGSASGVAPSAFAFGVPVPLVVDEYSIFVLEHLNAPPFANGLALLDAQGLGTATLTVPPLTDPGLAGVVLYHAAAVFDPSLSHVDLATNPVELVLVP